MATLLLTGATGKAGGFALAHMVAHPGVARIISLQRKALPNETPSKNSPKLKEVIVPSEPEWTDYPEEILAQLKDVSGCVWDLGSTKFPDMATTHRVSTDYTLHGLSAILQAQEASSSSSSPRRPVRFVYLSGALSERNQEAKLTLLADFRKARGRTENKLLEAAAASSAEVAKPSTEEADAGAGGAAGNGPALDLVAIIRSAMITDATANPPAQILSKLTGTLFNTVTAQELAAGMVELALHGKGSRESVGTDGNEVGRIVENDEIQKIGREALKGM